MIEITYIKAGHNHVYFQWEAQDDNSDLNIHRRDAHIHVWDIIDIVPGIPNSFYDNDVLSDEAYGYYVGYDNEDNASYILMGTEVDIALLPEDLPRLLIEPITRLFQIIGVKISFDGHPVSHLDGYGSERFKVYLDSHEVGTSTESPISITTDRTYDIRTKYTLTQQVLNTRNILFLTNGKTKEFSVFGVLIEPMRFTAEMEDNAVRINWRPCHYITGITGHKVLRKVIDDTEWSNDLSTYDLLVEDTNDSRPTFLDTTIVSGTEYAYRVAERIGEAVGEFGSPVTIRVP